MLSNFGKKTPFALITAVLFTLVGAVLLAGCGSSAAATPTPTPTATTVPTATPTPILNSTFTSSDGIYSFQFPGNWSQTPLSTSTVVNGVLLKSPDATDFFTALPFNQGFTAAQYPSLLSEFLKEATATSIVVNPKAQTVKLGANTWTNYDGTATVNGSPSMTSIFGLTHAGKTFVIIVIAANTNANTVGTTYFVPMVTSVMFLK